MSESSGRVLHLAHVAEWKQAQEAGLYDWSTRGLRLSEVGFIHTSGSHQVRGVAERFYADDPEPLLLLVIDIDSAVGHGSPFQWDEAHGQLFPHFYGPIPVTAVVAALPVSFDSSDALELPSLDGFAVLDKSPES